MFRPEGPFETRLFINNEFVPAVSGKTFSTVNPATEKVIAEVSVSLCDTHHIATSQCHL
jgi:acyl-CoA reductase-like NAD-dependent aldehyde dehydrogenase